MRQFMFVLVLLAALTTVHAQAVEPPKGYYFGMGAGAVTGYGLMYRDWTGPVGWQVEGMPILSTSMLNLNAGLTVLWLLNDSGWTRFFLYAGGMGTYNNVSVLDGLSPAWGAGLGGGLGLEVILWDHIALDLQGGYQFRWDNNSPYLGPTGEVAIAYRL